LNAYSQCLKPFDFSHRLTLIIKSATALMLITLGLHQQAQTQNYQEENLTSEHFFFNASTVTRGESATSFSHESESRLLSLEKGAFTTYRFTSTQKDTVPEPLGVMYKSMMIPGWGQVVNKQYWKVPIIYAALGGVIGYTIYLDGKYDDYRAAYYNSFADPEQGTYTDQKFGSTPGYLENVVASQLRHSRNYYKNTRDLMFVMTGLAYGLNILDAYIFAHLRDFDVSDDLSFNAHSSFDGHFSTITLTFNF